MNLIADESNHLKAMGLLQRFGHSRHNNNLLAVLSTDGQYDGAPNVYVVSAGQQRLSPQNGSMLESVVVSDVSKLIRRLYLGRSAEVWFCICVFLRILTAKNIRVNFY